MTLNKSPKNISFTRAKLKDLKEAYHKAQERGHDCFLFEGHTVLVTYAKYLIEYLELNFKPDTKIL